MVTVRRNVYRGSSRLKYSSRNVKGKIATVLPLHPPFRLPVPYELESRKEPSHKGMFLSRSFAFHQLVSSVLARREPASYSLFDIPPGTNRGISCFFLQYSHFVPVATGFRASTKIFCLFVFFRRCYYPTAGFWLFLGNLPELISRNVESRNLVDSDRKLGIGNHL